LFALALNAQETPTPEKSAKPKIHWQIGPAKVKLGDQADLTLPQGYGFADVANTRLFLEQTENIPTGRELGTIAPVNASWFALFEFDPSGYVKDDDKDKLDADAMLDSIKKATEAENEERRKRGWDTFHITSWIDPPHYESATHQLTWSLVGRDGKGIESANYRTRLLGRRGVMSVELIVSPAALNSVLPTFRNVATGGFQFTPANQYSAFVPGDKVAEYGLSALIIGGAAAAAVKTGFFKYILKFLIVGWKLVLVAAGAIGTFFKKLFSSRKSQQAIGD
jgi:uncharacterized membrane-anchored protein